MKERSFEMREESYKFVVRVWRRRKFGRKVRSGDAWEVLTERNLESAEIEGRMREFSDNLWRGEAVCI